MPAAEMTENYVKVYDDMTDNDNSFSLNKEQSNSFKEILKAPKLYDYVPLGTMQGKKAYFHVDGVQVPFSGMLKGEIILV